MATEKKNLSVYDKASIPEAQGLRIGIVVSEWNHEITHNLYQGALDALLDCGVSKEEIYKLDVPGSFELIYGAKYIFNEVKPHAIIVLGSVIRGETAHFDFVCQGVSNGVADLNIQLPVPVIFGVLTDDNEEQAKARSGGKHGNKGTECAIAAIKMANLNSYKSGS